MCRKHIVAEMQEKGNQQKEDLLMGKARTVGISREMVDRITEKAAEVAAERAVEMYQKQAAEEEKAKFDKRYRNTKLLLEHYRDFSDYGEKAIYRIYEELDEDIIDIIELMEGRKSDNDGRIESIERGVMRTRVIMNHVNTMLEVYRKSCESSPNQEEKRRWRAIEGLYLNKVPRSVQEIAEEEFINERTVYKDVKAACKRLTALIFGIDGFER